MKSDINYNENILENGLIIENKTLKLQIVNFKEDVKKLTYRKTFLEKKIEILIEENSKILNILEKNNSNNFDSDKLKNNDETIILQKKLENLETKFIGITEEREDFLNRIQNFNETIKDLYEKLKIIISENESLKNKV